MVAQARRRSKIAIINVRVFNGESLGEPTTVVINDGVISQDAHDAEVVDGQGGVLLPGFIDAHIHLNGERELRMMSQHGVTTGLDMATWPPSKIDALRHFTKEGLTDFRTPGVPATSPGSLHSILLPIPQEALLQGPQDAAGYVESRIKEGVDYIKMVVDVPGPDLATLKAVATEAHKHKKLVIAHATAYHTFNMAQEAGADVVTHVPRDMALDQEACLRMTKENRISVPTLVMMEAVLKPMGWLPLLQMFLRPKTLFAIINAKRKSGSGAGKQTYENARESVTALHRAGVPILAGSDCHEEPTSPFSVKHGDSLHRELELLVEAGLSTVEALQAATSLPAKYFGLPDRGAIEVGKRADLVLLSENPIADIRATRSIRKVWCAGIEVKMP